jgi:hypothetical protein
VKRKVLLCLLVAVMLLSVGTYATANEVKGRVKLAVPRENSRRSALCWTNLKRLIPTWSWR